MMKLVSLLLGGLGWLRKAAMGIIRWLFTDFRHLALAALAVVALGLRMHAGNLAQDRDRWKFASEEWETSALEWQAAHTGLIADVAAKTAAAERADRANAARVELEQQTTIERTKNDYETRLADTRTALGRLQHKLGAIIAADSYGGSEPTYLPEALSARCRAFGSPDCDTLLAALPERLAAAETNTAKLIELQNYVRAMLALDWGNTASPAVKPDPEGE